MYILMPWQPQQNCRHFPHLIRWKRCGYVSFIPSCVGCKICCTTHHSSGYKLKVQLLICSNLNLLKQIQLGLLPKWYTKIFQYSRAYWNTQLRNSKPKCWVSHLRQLWQKNVQTYFTNKVMFSLCVKSNPPKCLISQKCFQTLAIVSKY